MKILIKHTLNNIFKKPVRALLLIICVAVTVISAYLVFDMNVSATASIQSYFTRMVGKCDAQIRCPGGIKDEYYDGAPECTKIPFYEKTELLYKRDSTQYSYVLTENAGVYGIDFQKACELKIFENKYELEDDEVIISEKYAEDCALKEGEELVLHDKYNRDVKFTIAKIMTEKNFFTETNQYAAVVNLNAFLVLEANETSRPSECIIDVKDDDRVDEFVEKIKENVPGVYCRNLSSVGAEAAAQLKSLFVVIFILSFLLVIFITISLSERIVCERMSVIGTLRSLGISRSLTSGILLAENIFYGLTGAVAGTVLYMFIRKPLLSEIIRFGDGSSPVVKPVSVSTIIIVLAGAVFFECAAPVSALVKALKTSIRDIIFDNRDTEYRFSKVQTVSGIILLITGVITYFAGKKSMIVSTISLISLVISLSLIMPWILKAASKLWCFVSDKAKLPVLKLAAVEISSKKSTVSSAVLCVTAVCLSITMYVFSVSVTTWIEKTGYKADVMLFDLSLEKSQYTFVENIDGVNSVDYMYETYERVEVNGEKKDEDFNMIALPDKQFFDMIPDYPDSLDRDKFVMDKKFADKYKIKKGDTVDFTLHSDGIFPEHVSLTLTGFINTKHYDDTMPVLVINKDLFIEQYYDYPSAVLLKCDDPENVLETIKSHSVGSTDEYYTQDSYVEYMRQMNASIPGVLSVLLTIGVLLTIIGSSGNQIIGFEGRKREYAVLYSTSMNRKNLRHLIFLENSLSSLTAVVTAVFSGFFVTKLVERILDVIELSVEITVGIGTFAAAGLVFWIILMFTCISPLRSLRKMNTANELKYE